MTRWSISNRFLPISYEEFTSLSERFKQAAEASFGTECKMQVKAMTAPKVYTTFCDDEIQSGLDEINAARTLSLPESDRLSEKDWDRARYVELVINPVNPELAPSFAFAHAEFKGVTPRQATFYIQPDGEEVKDTMISTRKFLQSTGDGFSSNGVRSGAIPAGLGFLRKGRMF